MDAAHAGPLIGIPAETATEVSCPLPAVQAAMRAPVTALSCTTCPSVPTLTTAGLGTLVDAIEVTALNTAPRCVAQASQQQIFLGFGTACIHARVRRGRGAAASSAWPQCNLIAHAVIPFMAVGRPPKHIACGCVDSADAPLCCSQNDRRSAAEQIWLSLLTTSAQFC